MIRIQFALLVLLISGFVQAGELRVQAPVVDVEPLTEPAMEIERCADRPADDASLAAVLGWDLGLACTRERIESTTVTGYRVFYRWDDRVYSRVMTQPPGDSVALKVRLD